jgi:hypothetical protein
VLVGYKKVGCTKFSLISHFWASKSDFHRRSDQNSNSPVTTAERRAPHTSSHRPLPVSRVSRQQTRMRFNFPQYLFPAFLFRQHQLEQDPSPNSKKKSKPDDAVQAAGEASFTYLVCKGCHTPCTVIIDNGRLIQ